MLTGNFSAEMNAQRLSRVQADVGAHRAAERAAQSRRRQSRLSRPAAVLYRKALSAVALGLLLVVGVATAALAMPQAPEVVHKAAKSGRTAAHLRHLVGPGSPTDAWIAAAAFVAAALLLVALTERSQRHGQTA